MLRFIKHKKWLAEIIHEQLAEYGLETSNI